MASNLTIESPNLEKIEKEAGQFTRDAINVLWAALNDTRKQERVDYRIVRDMLQPKVLTLSPSSSVDDLDLEGCSVVSFIGSSSVNFTGMKAPSTGESRVVLVQVSGTGTITAKHESASSEASNRLTNAPGTDYSASTAKGIIYLYSASRWREVARSG